GAARPVRATHPGRRSRARSLRSTTQSPPPGAAGPTACAGGRNAGRGAAAAVAQRRQWRGTDAPRAPVQPPAANLATAGKRRGDQHSPGLAAVRAPLLGASGPEPDTRTATLPRGTTRRTRPRPRPPAPLRPARAGTPGVYRAAGTDAGRRHRARQRPMATPARTSGTPER